jgi:hypothetical protein
VAQGVLAEIVRPAAPSVTAGLRVFGSGTLGACQDTDLVVPLALANQERIADRLAALQAGASADAALAEAMVAAIRDLAETRGPHSLVVVTGGADACNAEAGPLIAQEAEKAGIQLQLFVVGYQVPDGEAGAIKAMVDAAGSSTLTGGAALSGAFLNAQSEDELRGYLLAIQAHVDRPEVITAADVQATAGAVAQGTAIAGPTAGPAATPASGEGTGVLALSVLAYAGQPAEAGGRLVVQAYRQPDHDTLIAADYNNPTQLSLPAGTYDLRLDYAAARSSPFVIGAVSQWIEGVTIEAGQTANRTYDLQLGQVHIDALEAAGKPVTGDNYSFALRLRPASDPSTVAATIIVTNTATLLLPAGRYQVQAEFPGTNLARVDQSGQTFDVIAGQAVDYTLNLRLGHLLLEVNDGGGRLVAPARVTVLVYPAGQRDQQFALTVGANPADLPLQAGQAYDLEVRLDGGGKLTLEGQQVAEGEVKTVRVSEREFK